MGPFFLPRAPFRMQIGHENLRGLDRDRLIQAIEPVTVAHGVDVVELVYRSDARGWALIVTVERPGSVDPALGVTLDLCAEISRDLSAALDVADAIPGRYRLEVGSPGVERALYGDADYQRFAGKPVRIKLREPIDGQRVVHGVLRGMDSGLVVVDAERGELRLAPERIEGARLRFEWKTARGDNGPAARGARGPRGRAAQRDR